MIRSEDIRDRVKDIDEYLLKKYKESNKIEKRDWGTYEQQLMKRVKGAIRNLEPLINEATNIEIHRGPGRPQSLILNRAYNPINQGIDWKKQQKYGFNA